MTAAPAPLAPAPTGDAQFWDRLARTYAKEPISDLAGYQRSIDRCRALLGAEARVLELGCGTGSTALLLAPHVAHITGADLSAEMITIAEEKRAAAGVANARFVAAASTDPRFHNGEYDAVLAMNLLHLVPELGPTLARARALLRPEGLLITKTPCLTDMSPLLRFALPLMRWVGKAPPTVRCFRDSELRAAFVAAGLQIVAEERHGTGRRDTRPFIVARRA